MTSYDNKTRSYQTKRLNIETEPHCSIRIAYIYISVYMQWLPIQLGLVLDICVTENRFDFHSYAYI